MSFIRHRRATSPNKFECRNVYSTNHIDVGKIHEDTFTTYKLLYYAERIVYVNYVGYFYRQRENSIMSSTFNMKNLSIVEATREACDFFSNNGEKYLFDCAVNSHFKTYIIWSYDDR